MNVRANIDMDRAGHAVQASHYADIRKRLFGVPAPKPRVIITKTVVKPEPAPEPIVLAQLPLWSVVDLYFDSHVRVWCEAIEREIAEDLSEMAYMPPRRLTKHIIAEVLENFPGVTWDDVKGKHRTLDVIYPRQLCMHAVHEQRKDLSYPQIGKLFGGRDHTTALHSIRKIQAMTSEDRETAYNRWLKHVST